MAKLNPFRPYIIWMLILIVITFILLLILYMVPNRQAPTVATIEMVDTIATTEPVEDNIATVNAVNGLSVRNKPGRKGKLLMVLPYQTELTLMDTLVAKDKMNGVGGYWYKVQYQQTVGFAWGPYISK